MPKVAHLSSAHPPFDIRIFHKQCKTLAKAGYETVFVVPHDRDETVDGVRIRAVAKPASRAVRMRKTVWDVYRAARAENADLYHFHDLEMIGPAFLLKLAGKKVVYDVHEDLPRQLEGKYYIPAALRGVIGRGVEAVEAFGATWLDGIAGVTRRIVERFPSGKTILLQNFPFVDELDAPTGTVPYAERPARFAYIGGITAIRGAREMVAAMGHLPEATPASLALAGPFGPPALAEALAQLPGWSRIEVLGVLSRDDVRDLLASCRAGLVLFHPLKNHVDAQPNKLFEYMSAGVPVLASDFPLWREIVGEAGSGVLVDPMKPAAIAEALAWLLAHPEEAEAMGRRGREAIVNRFNWETESQKLLALYERLLA